MLGKRAKRVTSFVRGRSTLDDSGIYADTQEVSTLQKSWKNASRGYTNEFVQENHTSVPFLSLLSWQRKRWTSRKPILVCLARLLLKQYGWDGFYLHKYNIRVWRHYETKNQTRLLQPPTKTTLTTQSRGITAESDEPLCCHNPQALAMSW